MVKRRVGGLVKAYVFYYLCLLYRIVTLGCTDGIIMFYDIDKLIKLLREEKFICYPNDKKRRPTMNMKDFKVLIKSKIYVAAKYFKEKDDFYFGYMSALQDIYGDILGFIKEENNHEDEGF